MGLQIINKILKIQQNITLSKLFQRSRNEKRRKGCEQDKQKMMKVGCQRVNEHTTELVFTANYKQRKLQASGK